MDEVSGNDRAMIKRVVRAIRKFKTRGFAVSLMIANMEDEAQKRVGLASKQRGRVACRDRRRNQRARGKGQRQHRIAPQRTSLFLKQS